MFKEIPYNQNYLISINGEIRKRNGSKHDLNIDNNKVLILFDGSKVSVDIYWLSLLATFEINTLKIKGSDIFNIKFLDTNPKVTRSVTGKIMFFNKALTITHENIIYRIVPNFTQYAVSCDGKVLELATLDERKPILNLKRHSAVVEYPSVYIYCAEKSNYKYIYIHRLVAMAWCKNNDYLLRPIVNHIDGNKQNYHYKNLEWCSYSENSIHAIKYGLRGDGIKCKIRNFLNGEIRNFNSLSEANIYMGYNTICINRRNFYKIKSRLIKNKYEIKLEDDNTPWFYENKTEKVKNGRYVINVINEAGESKYFSDTREFIKEYGLWNCNSLKNALNNFKNKYPFYKVTVDDNYRSSFVESYNLTTNEVLILPTIVKMSKATGVKEDTIRACLRSEDLIIKNNYLFRPFDEKIVNWDLSNIQNRDFKKYGITATNISDGSSIKFESTRATAKSLKCDRTSIKNCLLNNIVLKNIWKLRYT
jgi:hypothetical protein